MSFVTVRVKVEEEVVPFSYNLNLSVDMNAQLLLFTAGLLTDLQQMHECLD